MEQTKQKNRFLKIKKFMPVIVFVAVLGLAWVAVALGSTITDSFVSEAFMGKGTNMINVDTSNHNITLASCYVANPSWTFVATTAVRDISNITNYNATVSKDIFCDNSNCILYPHGTTPTATECIATDPSVYANLLWSKTDSTSKAWAGGSAATTSISGGDVGTTLASGLLIGAGGTSVGGGKNLVNYYSSPSGTYPAMDVCKLKGSGWRLPNFLELDSIRDMTTGAAPYSKLPGIASSIYWSSSEYSATSAWALGFNSGYTSSSGKSSSYGVRCVRGY